MTIGFNAYGVAVDYTSANLGAAAFNCLPVTTFLFALILRYRRMIEFSFYMKIEILSHNGVVIAISSVVDFT